MSSPRHETLSFEALATFVGRYSNHDDDCPKRTVPGRPYPEHAQCDCGYLETAQTLLQSHASLRARLLGAEQQRDLLQSERGELLRQIFEKAGERDEKTAQLVAAEQARETLRRERDALTATLRDIADIRGGPAAGDEAVELAMRALKESV